jgi:protein-disulfide isomerase
MAPWRRYPRPTMVGRQKTLMIRALLVAAAWLVTLPGPPPGPRQAPDPLAARTKGRAAAPVTVYEMSDFQCPYCREFALGTMPVLEREYIQAGKVRFVYINLPLSSVHKNAAAAAEVALCAARQQRFWPMHDQLFRHQNQWATLPSPKEYFLALGDSAGLDRARLARCVAAGSTAADVRADAERARRSGATSTPTFYIEGALLEGAAPVTVFRAVLDSIYRSKTAAGR